jgi:hypothetical protein
MSLPFQRFVRGKPLKRLMVFEADVITSLK